MVKNFNFYLFKVKEKNSTHVLNMIHFSFVLHFNDKKQIAVYS